MTEQDTRTFTPHEIAISAAKRLAGLVVDMDPAWIAAIAEHGIELAEDGAFTIATEGGQTFKVSVIEY